jgi:negative regulator of flagellin synthesis FlgM
MKTGLEARLNRGLVVGYDAAGLIVQRSTWVSNVAGSRQEGRADMDVRGVGSVSGTTPLQPVSAPTNLREASAVRPQSPRDALELSAAGKMLDQLSHSPDVRQERLARIKAAIDNGTYDTDEKLEAALSKMFDAQGLELDEE